LKYYFSFPLLKYIEKESIIFVIFYYLLNVVLLLFFNPYYNQILDGWSGSPPVPP